MTLPKIVFLDTAYAIALSAASDEHHEKAVTLAKQLEQQQTQLVTARSVILEIGNAMSKQRYRADSIALLEAIEQDPTVQIVPLTEDLFKRAFQLYRNRLDKEWGITDCISFIVMQDAGLKEALTTDRHFTQAGFKALLR